MEGDLAPISAHSNGPFMTLWVIVGGEIRTHEH